MESSSDTNDGVKSSQGRRTWFSLFNSKAASSDAQSDQDKADRPSKWSMGVLNDKRTHEVPGSVLLLANLRNEPLGLRNAPARTSRSSIPSPYPSPSPARRSRSRSMRRSSYQHSNATKKLTSDGTIVLDPQPEDSDNDPLNWPAWRRDSALLSLGLYCMLGGGMTSVLAAGFTDVATTYNVSVPRVALTTGLYMLGLGMGSVFASPTAILYGKRPVYLAGCFLFVATSIWCALSPSYPSLVAARVLQGVAVSPVECLPSATIAEIFFLHERAYRIGIYTLLLLGGKNLVPLVSAAIIEALDWRWVFWVVAIIVGFCGFLVFFFVPETFWDRTPRPRGRSLSRLSSVTQLYNRVVSPGKKSTEVRGDAMDDEKQLFRPSEELTIEKSNDEVETPRLRPALNRRKTPLHVEFSPSETISEMSDPRAKITDENEDTQMSTTTSEKHLQIPHGENGEDAPVTNHRSSMSSVANQDQTAETTIRRSIGDVLASDANTSNVLRDLEAASDDRDLPLGQQYTTNLRGLPKRTFIQQLRPYEGRLHQDNWLRVAARPFVLFAYPAVLWSAAVYACAVGWLIVLSETVAVVYRDSDSYNFSALGTGLIYISPFIGGILGTVVAGRVSDMIVRAFSRRNGGLYEPEFRLVMGIPITLTTVIGLMGFGWSAENRDSWIVPTVFFGIMSFGCTLGSTTAITFCVDSYRQYAGEALVTLNFSKNILHGLVFSLFVNEWIEHDGVKKVFLALGGIQLALMATTVPLYIYGKRARMWTVRVNLMERL